MDDVGCGSVDVVPAKRKQGRPKKPVCVCEGCGALKSNGFKLCGSCKKVYNKARQRAYQEKRKLEKKRAKETVVPEVGTPVGEIIGVI